MNKVIFLNKKQLMKLNHKERQDYLSTQKRYNKFQIPLMTGMINHIKYTKEMGLHEFNRVQHKLDEKYLIEIYEEIINKNYSKIEKEETKVAIEERIVEKDTEINDGLMNKIKRLKRLYNKGTLTKAEFEKAKNKLLK